MSQFREIAVYRSKVRIANPQISRGCGAQRPGYRPTRVERPHGTFGTILGSQISHGAAARGPHYGHVDPFLAGNPFSDPINRGFITRNSALRSLQPMNALEPGWAAQPRNINIC